MLFRTKFFAAIGLSLTAFLAGATDYSFRSSVEAHTLRQVHEGRQTFRYATFGDEAFWGDTLGLHEAIAHGPARDGPERRAQGGRGGPAAITAA